MTSEPVSNSGRQDQTFPGQFEASGHGSQFIGNNLTSGASINIYPQPQQRSQIPDRLFSVPYDRDDSFIPRQQIFDQIDALAARSKPVVLQGLGGTGKSQIAIEYSHRFQEKHRKSYVLWILAISTESIRQSFKDIATRLKLPEYNSPNVDHCQLVSNWLQEDEAVEGEAKEPKKWLVLVDNADSLKVVKQNLVTQQSNQSRDDTTTSKNIIDYLPIHRSQDRQVLVTTRNRDVAIAIATPLSMVEVGPFSPDESLMLFRDRLGSGYDLEVEETCELLLEKLDFFPLAITQAAAYMKRNYSSPAEYLSVLRAKDVQLSMQLTADLEDPRRKKNHPNSVFQTWKVSYDEIGADDALAVRILSLISFFNDKEIPVQLFYDAELASHAEIKTALGTIASYSLINMQPKSGMITIHSLVSAAIRYALRADNMLIRRCDEAVEILSRLLPRERFDKFTSTKKQYTLLSLHTEAALGFSATIHAKTQQRVKLLTYMATWKFAEYRFSEALNYAQAALDTCYELEELPIPLFVLATLFVCGCLDEAYLYEDVVRTAKKTLSYCASVAGTEEHDVLELKLILCSALLSLERYEESNSLYYQTMTSHKTSIRKRNLMNLDSRLRLFSWFLHHGKYTESNKILSEVMEDIEGFQDVNAVKVFHIRLVQIYNFLFQGKSAESISLARELLDDMNETPDTTSLLTFYALTKLVEALRFTHDYEAIKSLSTVILRNGFVIQSPDHAAVVSLHSTLAAIDAEIASVLKYGPLSHGWTLQLDNNKKLLGFEMIATNSWSLTDPRKIRTEQKKLELGPLPRGWAFELDDGGSVYFRFWDRPRSQTYWTREDPRLVQSVRELEDILMAAARDDTHRPGRITSPTGKSRVRKIKNFMNRFKLKV